MDENVLFYLEVNSFRTAGGELGEYLTHVKRIHDLYIMPTSPRQVNISGDIQIATSAAVSAVSNGRPVKVRCQRTAVKTGCPTKRHGFDSSGRENEDGDAGHIDGECSQRRYSFGAGTSGTGGGECINNEGGGGGGGEGRGANLSHRPPKQAKEGGTGRDGRAQRRSVRLPGGKPPPLPSRPPRLPRLRDATAPALPPRPPRAPPDAGTRVESAITARGFRSTGGLKADETVRLQGPAEALRTVVGIERVRARSLAETGWAAEREEREDEAEELGARNQRDCHDDYSWPDRPRDLGVETLRGSDASMDIEELGLGIGPGGGVGDRTVFDLAQDEIYDVLKTEVYPKFLADVCAHSRETSWASMPRGVDALPGEGSEKPSPKTVQRLVKAVLAMKPPP